MAVRGGRAVVIGGGLAGLLAARVLAPHFDDVVLVERDVLPAGPAPRPGVPQARHVHNLLARGSVILERLLPGLDAELGAAGAPVVDWTADCRWLLRRGWSPRVASGIVTRGCTRDLLEWAVRRRVMEGGGVRFEQGWEVTALLPGSAPGVVAGVRRRRAPEPGERLVPPALRAAVGGLSLLNLGVGLLLFVRPDVGAAIWPWQLTPLTARVLGGWFALPAVTGLALAGEGRWSAWRIPLQSALLGLLLILAGAGRAWSDFDPRSALTWPFVLAVALTAALFLALHLALDRARPPANPPGTREVPGAPAGWSWVSWRRASGR